MALRFVDSFDHYTTVSQKWSGDGGGVIIDATGARTGIGGIRKSGGSAGYIETILDAQGTWIIGLAYKTTDVMLNEDIIRVKDGTNEQGVLRFVVGGFLALDRGGTQVAITADPVIPLANVWHYIELKHTIANAGGLLEVRVDGSQVATFTGDTQETGNATADRIRIIMEGNTVRMDDLYILDGTGGSNDDYLGDQRVDALLPDGAGAYTEFATLVGAASHYEAVDEADPDDDTSYVEETTVDDRDTFTFANHPLSSASIAGIQVLMRARKNTAGDAKIARLYRRGSDDQGSDVALQTSYAYHREIMETDPIAAAPWTPTNINAAEFGVRVR